MFEKTSSAIGTSVYSLNRWARQPDLTIHLKIKAHQAYARMRQRLKARDLYENNLQARGHKYQEGIALLREKGETIVEVDAEAAFSQVFADVLAAVQAGAPGGCASSRRCSSATPWVDPQIRPIIA